MTTPTADAFRRLREQARRPRPAARTPLASRALQSIDLRERIEARLRPALDALQEAVPELQPVRRVDSGAWVLGLARHLQPADRAGRAARPFSRIEFAVEVEGDLDTCAITCRATAFDRDLPTKLEVFRTTDLRDEAIDKLAEECCLEFARRYHEGDAGAEAARLRAELALRAQVN